MNVKFNICDNHNLPTHLNTGYLPEGSNKYPERGIYFSTIISTISKLVFYGRDEKKGKIYRTHEKSAAEISLSQNSFTNIKVTKVRGKYTAFQIDLVDSRIEISRLPITSHYYCGKMHI